MTKNAVEETDIKTHKINASKVKSGDLMALITYVKVVRTSRGGDFLSVENADSSEVKTFDIDGRDIVESSYSADQFEEEIKVTKTRMAEILTTSYNRPFTVVFDKEDGSERTLRGRLIQPEPMLGRSKVEDLDLKESHRIRLVDHRTVKSLIISGVKYITK